MLGGTKQASKRIRDGVHDTAACRTTLKDPPSMWYIRKKPRTFTKKTPESYQSPPNLTGVFGKIGGGEGGVPGGADSSGLDANSPRTDRWPEAPLGGGGGGFGFGHPAHGPTVSWCLKA